MIKTIKDKKDLKIISKQYFVRNNILLNITGKLYYELLGSNISNIQQDEKQEVRCSNCGNSTFFIEKTEYKSNIPNSHILKHIPGIDKLTKHNVYSTKSFKYKYIPKNCKKICCENCHTNYKL